MIWSGEMDKQPACRPSRRFPEAERIIVFAKSEEALTATVGEEDWNHLHVVGRIVDAKQTGRTDIPRLERYPNNVPAREVEVSVRTGFGCADFVVLRREER